MTEDVQLTVNPPAQPARRSPLRRAGCILGLVLWFLLLLTPCGLFYLATQGEIILTLNETPPQLVRVWLVMEAKERGIGLSRPTVIIGEAANEVCVQTDVSFWLWQGQGDRQNSTYCDCYVQDGEVWTLARTGEGVCRP
jgi:hypothetical protein